MDILSNDFESVFGGEGETCATPSDDGSLFGDGGESDSHSPKVGGVGQSYPYEVIDLTNDDDDDDGEQDSSRGASRLPSTIGDIRTTYISSLPKATIGDSDSAAAPHDPFQLLGLELALQPSALALSTELTLGNSQDRSFFQELGLDINNATGGVDILSLLGAGTYHVMPRASAEISLDGGISTLAATEALSNGFDFNAAMGIPAPSFYSGIGILGQSNLTSQFAGSTNGPVVGAGRFPIPVPASKRGVSSRPDFVMASLNRRGPNASSMIKHQRMTASGSPTKPHHSTPGPWSNGIQTTSFVSPISTTKPLPSTPKKGVSTQPRSNSATPTSFKNAFDRSKRVVEAFKVQKAQQREVMGIELIGIDTHEVASRNQQHDASLHGIIPQMIVNGDGSADELIRELEKWAKLTDGGAGGIYSEQIASSTLTECDANSFFLDPESSVLFGFRADDLLPNPTIPNSASIGSTTSVTTSLEASELPAQFAISNQETQFVTYSTTVPEPLMAYSLPLQCAPSQSTRSDTLSVTVTDDATFEYGNECRLDFDKVFSSMGRPDEVGVPQDLVNDWLSNSVLTDAPCWDDPLLEEILVGITPTLPDFHRGEKRKLSDDDALYTSLVEDIGKEGRTVKRMRPCNR